jgi:hypothetical protein
VVDRRKFRDIHQVHHRDVPARGLRPGNHNSCLLGQQPFVEQARHKDMVPDGGRRPGDLHAIGSARNFLAGHQPGIENHKVENAAAGLAFGHLCSHPGVVVQIQCQHFEWIPARACRKFSPHSSSDQLLARARARAREGRAFPMIQRTTLPAVEMGPPAHL